MATFCNNKHAVAQPIFGFYVIIFMIIFSHAAYNENQADLGVRAQSFGGAYRALGTSNDIIFFNPAGLIKHRRIEFDLDYKVSINTPLHDFGASIMDSKTTAWGLGLAYNGAVHQNTSRPMTHLVHLALAMPIVTDMFSLGTSLSYLYDVHPQEQPYRHFFNIDVGAMATLPIGLSFALVLDHLLSPKGQEKGLGLSLAMAFELGEIVKSIPLSFSFDWLMDKVKSKESLHHVISTGAQYILFDVLPLRIGFKSRLAESHHFISLGTGIIIKSFAIDGLYQQHLAIGRIRQFGLALRLVF